MQGYFYTSEHIEGKCPTSIFEDYPQLLEALDLDDEIIVWYYTKMKEKKYDYPICKRRKVI